MPPTTTTASPIYSAPPDTTTTTTTTSSTTTTIAPSVPDGSACATSTTSSNFAYVGNAALASSSPDTFRLTDNLGGQNGAIWHKAPFYISEDFCLKAQVYLGATDGADGLAFVMQTAVTASGVGGGGLGYQGVTPSFALEFDTYWNSEGSDLYTDHVGLMKNGSVDHGASQWGVSPVDVGNIDDNYWRYFKLFWNSDTKKLSVLLDLNADGDFSDSGETVFNDVSVDLGSVFTSGNAYWGFTAATGAATNLQQVRNITYDDLTGAASAPTSVVATSGRSGVSVSWTAPTSNGGSAITDYLVEYATTSGGSYTAFNDGTSTTTSATITGLTADSTYYVRVAAVNALSTGTYSSESSGVLSKTCANGGVCAVGDTGPGGGKVFYVSASAFASTGSDCGSNCYFLEAAPSDHSTAIVWATSDLMCYNADTGSSNNGNCQITSVYSGSSSVRESSRTASSAIGKGMANTENFAGRLAGYPQNSTSFAAGIAWAYSNNSKTDWFLPSTLELNQLCRYAWNLTVDNTATTCTGRTGTIRTGFSTYYYWSSSEYGANLAWSQGFGVDDQTFSDKSNALYVRPVRAF